LFRVIVIFKLSLIGMMQRFADAASKMDIRSGHQCRACLFLHRHDAFERVFRTLVFFMVAHEVHDLVVMCTQVRVP
jgi:hypothetical protein